MKFNNVKCVQMTISNKRKTIPNNYYLENKILLKKDNIKYLGIIIDNKLTFKNRIQDKTKKATTILNMLRRNLHFAPKSVKIKAFQSCVLPIVEYASTCWAPTSKKLSNSLEMILHNGAKFVTNKYPNKENYINFSISTILENLNWHSIEERRIQARLTMAFKILKNHTILEPNMLPTINRQRPERNCKGIKVGVKDQLFEPYARLDVIQNTFFYATPQLWNKNVTQKQANSPSVDSFQRYFKK